jgi:hypothetical protein
MRASLGPEKLYTESLVRDFFREKRLSDGPWDISFRNNGFESLHYIEIKCFCRGANGGRTSRRRFYV